MIQAWMALGLAAWIALNASVFALLHFRTNSVQRAKPQRRRSPPHADRRNFYKVEKWSRRPP